MKINRVGKINQSVDCRATPLVSVIMPSFNSGQYIKKAIQSVLAQSFFDFEILIIDGGSVDNTIEIIKYYAERDGRVIYLNNVNDKGPAHARSIGINRCSGKYVAFLDADDIWLPNKLLLQTEFMRLNDVSFCYTSYRIMDKTENQVTCIVPMYKSYNFYQALSRRGIGTLTVMISRHLLDAKIIQNNEKFHGEEYLWWLLILKQGNIARHLNEDTARYRQTDNSLSSHRYKHQMTVWHSYRNEVGLGLFLSSAYYTSYLFDVTLRRIRVTFCGWISRRGGND
jgi:teichuronic acid biosynthesis glycosyltransferase TuaG